MEDAVVSSEYKTVAGEEEDDVNLTDGDEDRPLDAALSCTRDA